MPRTRVLLASTAAMGWMLSVGGAAAATERLTIVSDSSCPSEEAVGQALLGLRPAGDWRNGTATIHAQDRFLVVDPGTDTASRRQLEVGTDCATRAIMVAVVIATWMDDLPAESTAAPVLRSPTPVQRSPTSTVMVPASVRTEREIGLGLLMAASGGIVPGLRLDFVQSRNPHGVGWQASLVLPARRELSTQVGNTRWTRPSVSVALNARLAVGRFSLAGDAGLAACTTLASVQGYAIKQDAQSFTVGVVAGLRAGILWRRVRVWADLRFLRWLYAQGIQIDSASGEPMTSSLLPSWDGQLSLGLSCVFR